MIFLIVNDNVFLACPPKWHDYQGKECLTTSSFFHDKLKTSNSNDACRNIRYSSLASMETKDKVDFTRAFLPVGNSGINRYFRISLVEYPGECSWVWSHTTGWYWTAPPTDASEIFWMRGNPDDARGAGVCGDRNPRRPGEHCGSLLDRRGRNGINDIGCSAVFPYVCQGKRGKQITYVAIFDILSVYRCVASL